MLYKPVPANFCSTNHSLSHVLWYLRSNKNQQRKKEESFWIHQLSTLHPFSTLFLMCIHLTPFSFVSFNIPLSTAIHPFYCCQPASTLVAILYITHMRRLRRPNVVRLYLVLWELFFTKLETVITTVYSFVSLLIWLRGLLLCSTLLPPLCLYRYACKNWTTKKKEIWKLNKLITEYAFS